LSEKGPKVIGFRELMFPVQVIADDHKNRVRKNLVAIDEGIFQQSEVHPFIFTSFTIMYGRWKCNWSCPQFCYTKNLEVPDVDNTYLQGLILSAQKMGAKFTYWPGTGEITLFKGFWDIQKFQGQHKIPAVAYSNGSVFVDDRLALSALGISSDQAVELLELNPDLHIYIKFWSTDEELARKLVGVTKERDLPYTDYKGLRMPLAFARLHERFGSRIGLQTMVIPENFEDYKNNILPFCLANGINVFAEPVINSGAAAKSISSMLSATQMAEIQQFLASGVNYCQARQYGELILIGNKLTPGIAIPPRDEDVVASEADLLKITSDSYFAEYRKMSLKENACVCREYWLKK